MVRALHLALAISVVVLVAGPACKRKRLYDGTCTEDAHCLDIQKCQGGVCVRRKPAFEEPPPAPVAKQPASKPAAPARVEPRVLIDERAPEIPADPAPPKAAPIPSAPTGPGAPERTRMRIRLDA